MKYLPILLLLLVGCNLATSEPVVMPLAPQTQVAQAPVATSTPIPAPPIAARPTYTVQRGLVQKDIAFTGRWLPRDQAILSFPIAGTLRAITVKAGDSIVAGQLLAEYQIDELKFQEQQQLITLEGALRRLNANGDSGGNPLVQAQFGVASANLSLQQARDSAPWVGTVTAQRALEDAQRALDNARRAYDEVRGDPVKNTASAIEAAYNSVLSAESALQNAQMSYYSAAEAYNTWRYSVLNAENALLQSQVNLANTEGGVGVNPELIDNVRNAQITLERTRQQISQSTLLAPFDGIVLEVRLQAGANVQAFAPVLTIALPHPYEVVATLSANDARTLDIGRLGVCQVAGQADTLLQCMVRRIPLTPTDADQTVRLAADFRGVLATGQLIEARLPLQIRDNVLWLPPAAIRRFQNRTFVVVQTPNGEQVVDVVLGLETETRTEIINGLAEGEVVIGQ